MLLQRGNTFQEIQSARKYRVIDDRLLRAFRRAALSRMRLVHEGMAFSEEIKIEALRVGLRFLEIPVDYRVRVGDRKIRSMSDAMKNFVWLVRKRFGWHPAPH